jgi:sugar lactone lactonase YvrE
MLDKVLENGPKLVKIDLASDKVVQTILFDKTIAPEKSYLNDIRIDNQTGHAYITESGVGSLIVVDLKSGKARRVLERDPTTKAEPDKPLIVDGMTLIEPKTGSTPQFNADGIAFDQARGLLYYHALTARNLYRVKTSDLLNEDLTDKELAARVTKLGETPSPDVMITGRDGSIYLAAFEKNAIVRVNPESGQSDTVLEDDRLQWPDTMSWGPGGELYVTTSQIHRMPKFHGGKSARKEPYRLYKLKIE